ncbi:MAG: hypothetical protein C4524_03100 [Candidatus Zixiibacteriota bacterium]|nr:MAG: hypothetical protein C4524_03100 [candidate division Zixibacteria bacterium]
MNDHRIAGPLGAPLVSFRAGALGGLLAGIVELLLVSGFGSHPAALSGLLFAALAYGLLGGLIGVAAHLGLSLLPFHADRRRDRRLLSAFMVAKSFSAVLFLVFLFRAFRDFHAEKVKPASPAGLLTVAVLAVAAVVLFFLLKALLSGKLVGLTDRLVRPVGWVVVLAAVLLTGVALQAAFNRETEEVHVPYAAGGADPADQPNVLVILIDTLRPDRLGCYGGPASTPNIDALARDGILFRTTYAQSNNTKPSTASLLTSRYLNEHRAMHKTDMLTPAVTTLAEAFSEAGYFCGGIVTNVNLAPIYNFQQGFHEYTYLPPKFLFGANESASRLVVYGVLRQIRMKLVKSIWPDNFYRPAEVVTGRFNGFLKQHHDRRFFAYLHYMDPHDPFFEHPYNGKGYARVVMPNPDPKFVEPFMANYDREIEYIDQWIGAVTDELKAVGLYDSCLIVLTSDHGEEFYEHGGWWHGTTLQEEQIRVPLVIKRPGGAAAGTVCEDLARLIDVAPTALIEAGVEVPEKMRGRNLLAALEFPPDTAAVALAGNEPAPAAVPQEVYSEADFEGCVGQALRVGPWKYLLMNPDNKRGLPEEQLYYLPDDPQETNNLAAAHPEKVAEMKPLLLAYLQDALSRQEMGASGDIDRATQERLRALGYTQ